MRSGGYEAFIKRQYSTIAFLAIVLAIVIFGVYFLTGQQDIATFTALAFIVGASCSALPGSYRYVGCRQDKHPHGSSSTDQ